MRTAVVALVSTVLVVTPARAQSEAWRVHGTSTVPSSGGISLAWLADVNGDGVPDFATGGPSLTDPPGTGQVQICSGADGSVLFDLFGEVGAGFGQAVARAGDIDGDGLDDLAVGAPTNGNGAVYYFSTATGAQLRKLSGPSAGSQFGTSIADLGDVDGDGVRDLAIGAPLDTSSGSNLGLAEIVSGATGSVIVQWTGSAVDCQFGSVVADAGDHDGDGLDDVLVLSQNVNGSGKLTIRSSGTFLNLKFWKLGAYPSDWTASGAGDVNGDGIPDVIVGNDQWPQTGTYPNFNYGEVWVYDGATGGVIRSHTGYVEVGSTVCGAGDVDGDGFADYAYYWVAYAYPMAVGYVTIISGQTGATLASVSILGWAVVGGATDTNGDGVPDLLTGTFPVVPLVDSHARVFDPVTQAFLTDTYSTARVDALGRASALLDDVNGDGTRDVLVGEGDDGYFLTGGHARILSGVDRSELRDHPPVQGSGRYARCVAALPDLDGDAIGEYAITVSDSWTIPGFVEVRSGATGNLLNTLSAGGYDYGSFGSSCAVAIQPSGAVELAVGCPDYNIDGTAIVFDVATGNVVVSVAGSSGVNLGTSICHLGDVDGDGVGDWAAGGENSSVGGDVVVFSGQSGSTIQTLQGVGGAATCGPGDLDGDGIPDLMVGSNYGGVDLFSGATWTLVRSWQGNLGSSLTVVGDVNQDGFNDVLVGGSDSLGVGQAYLYSGGSGGLLYRFGGAMTNDDFGGSIAGVAAPGSVGSMNGDAIPDVAIGGEADTTNGYQAGRLSLYFLDDFYLQVDPNTAAAGQTVTLTSSGGPAGNLAGLFFVGFDSTPLFQLVGLSSLDSEGIWAVSGVVPPGLAGHTISLESITVGFTGKLATTQPMLLTLQ